MPETTPNDIDRVVHEPARLRILGQLYVVDSADFLFVMQQTGLTQGNLSSHMSKLEAAGYVDVEKDFVGKRPHTALRLTAAGREAFEDYVESMKKLLGQVAPAAKTKRARRAALIALKACIALVLACAAHAKTIEVPFTTHDGYPMRGKLTLPDAGQAAAVVIYVQNAEGATVDMKRPLGGGRTFNYFDVYRTKLTEGNVGFFSYEGRGLTTGDAPPRYESVDWPVYNTSTLENKVRDVLSAVEAVRKQEGLGAVRLFLMGASEGSLLAVEAASRIPEQIHGVAVYGVLSTNMRDTFRFILTDGGYMVYRDAFDTKKDGVISKAEFEADPRRYRERVFRNAGFENFDRDGDGLFTVEEMGPLAAPLADAIDSENFEVLNQWARTSAGVVTPENWFRDHFAHTPLWTFLSKLDMPVGLFNGEADSNASAAALRKLEAQAREAGKLKMEFRYFEGLDHSLGVARYFVDGTLPAGHQAIFEFIFRNTR